MQSYLHYVPSPLVLFFLYILGEGVAGYDQLKTTFDFLIVNPTEPLHNGYVHSYTSKPIGGYLEIIVTPILGNLTKMELRGAQKVIRELNPDFIDFTTRIKSKDVITITPHCSGDCTYTLRLAQKRNYAMPMLHRLLPATPQSDTIGEDTLFTGIVTKYYQIVAPRGSDSLVLRAAPYNGRISVLIYKCKGVSYTECLRDQFGYIHQDDPVKDHFRVFTAPPEKRKGRGRGRSTGVGLAPMSEKEQHSQKDSLITISRNDAEECSYVIRVEAKKLNRLSPVITRYQLTYWWEKGTDSSL